LEIYEKFLCSLHTIYKHFVNRYCHISGLFGNTLLSSYKLKKMRRLPVLSFVLKRALQRSSDEPTHQPVVTDQANVENVLGRELGLMTRLVGCSHKEMGRPFAEGNVRYRSCMKCGARRQFNLDTFETFGKFYLPPATTKNL
jgi:hypothetical protein